VFIPLLKGENVMAGKLAPKDSARGLAALIPKGMQAITIQTPNVATGVAGFILPGNWVDVLLTFNNQGTPTASGSTIRLLQHVEILAVDQRVDAPMDNKVDVKELRSVTLLVTPRQGALVALGQNKGTLQLALRNPRDDQDAKFLPVTDHDLGIKSDVPKEEPKKAEVAVAKPAPPPAPPPPPEPPQPSQIRAVRGSAEGVIYLYPPQD
jgi:pilus assembly protein CpaB